MGKMLLTDISVRALKGSERYEKFFDTKTVGFGIRVGKRAKTWIVMRGKNRELITIGKYPDVSLADARTEAKRLLAEVNNAPLEKAVSKTVRDGRDEYLREHFKGSASGWKHKVELMLNKHLKGIEHRQIVDIGDADINKILGNLKDTPSAQLHVYRAMRTFFTWCTRPPRRYLKHSPMEGYPPPGKDRKGTRILTDEELAAVWKASKAGTRQVLRLMILWGTRNEETCVIRRKWASEGILNIPGDSTKNGRDHAIPILPLAQEVLDSRPEDGEFYFPGRHSNTRPINPSSLNRILDEVQADSGTSGWTLRDIRRTFRSNMARLRVPRDVAEVLINHTPGGLDEIYDRYDRQDEKREALAKYEAFLLGLLAKA